MPVNFMHVLVGWEVKKVPEDLRELGLIPE